MVLHEKFKSGAEFAKYASFVSGYTFDTVKLEDWYQKNTNFVLTYTGVMRQIAPFVTGKVPKTK